MKVYDSIIIGGGPAGLSAAIYLARFNRSVLIIDKGYGYERWNTNEINENYLGFPHGIPSRHLHKLGVEQAQRFGAEIVTDEITQITKINDGFDCTGASNRPAGRSIIIATGVRDLFPQFSNVDEYIGRSLFWCITCDGYKTKNKRIVVVGQDNEAVCTCLQFLNFTTPVGFVTNSPPRFNSISAEWKMRLARARIPLYEGVIQSVNGTGGMMESIVLNTRQVLELDYLFSQQGSVPNSDVAAKAGIQVDQAGYVITDKDQRTNIPLAYAAGDITRDYAHQIVTAVHEGSMAAQAANYDLYSPDQRI